MRCTLMAHPPPFFHPVLLHHLSSTRAPGSCTITLPALPTPGNRTFGSHDFCGAFFFLFCVCPTTACVQPPTPFSTMAVVGQEGGGIPYRSAVYRRTRRVPGGGPGGDPLHPHPSGRRPRPGGPARRGLRESRAGFFLRSVAPLRGGGGSGGRVVGSLETPHSWGGGVPPRKMPYISLV